VKEVPRWKSRVYENPSRPRKSIIYRICRENPEKIQQNLQAETQAERPSESRRGDPAVELQQ